MDGCQEIFWNRIDMVSPDLWSLDIIGDKPHVIGSSLFECFDRILSDLSCLKQLNYEGAVISRLVYRYKRKLHADKGFKSLQKINHVLHNYLKINLTSVLDEIKSYILEKKGPSREVLEWGLVSVLRFCSLFHKVYTDCLDGARYMKERFRSGDFWSGGIILLASVSRIWTFSLYIVKKSAVWYKELKAFLPYLKSSGTQWLPDNFKLPKTINEWLKHPKYLEQDSTTERAQTSLDSMLNERPSSEPAINICKSLVISEDLGESISRETGELLVKHKKITKEEIEALKLKKIKADRELFKKKKSSKRKFENLDFLKSRNDVVEFLCKEGVLRKANQQCMTKHLNDNQYDKMRRSVMNIANEINDEITTANDNKLDKILKCTRYYLFHFEDKVKSD